ncbi:hypothetical protein [Spirosoma luteum]|uniref:hypothetical protein n=1 Tax=Spirosoma luteum TaxID=431553 RepID=UPI00058ACEA0|nr:hypothetical protein [Spirosoma luteum]
MLPIPHRSDFRQTNRTETAKLPLSIVVRPSRPFSESGLVEFTWSVYPLIVPIGQPTLLNPVELVWSYLKGRLKNKAFMNLEELTAVLLEEVKGVEANPKLVKAFFTKKEIAFITD